jgi:CheY-like chemotaxis protein
MPRDRILVLCIDDNRPGLEIRKQLLEAKGFRVITAQDGASGLEIASREEIDAVILDYRMPGVDGGEVAARLREKRQDIPILLLSGFTGTIPDSLLSIVDSFVEKGRPSAHLIAELERITGSRDKREGEERKRA